MLSGVAGWQGGVSSQCVCVCGMYVCDVYNVRVACVHVCMCIYVRVHTHVCGARLRLYVVLNCLHFLSL